MPLRKPVRAVQPTEESVPAEQTRQEVTERVLHNVESLVTREVRRQMRFDSPEVRRLSDTLCSDLGSRIVFERERLGRT